MNKHIEKKRVPTWNAKRRQVTFLRRLQRHFTTYLRTIRTA